MTDTSLPSDADPDSMSIDAARQIIFSAIEQIKQSETIAVIDASGRTVSEAVLASVDVPPFRASAMDGYAFRHKEYAQPLKISAHSLAGHPSGNDADALECHRVTTGARVPDFADTVVQQENVTVDDHFIQIEKVPETGLHVRPAGSDSQLGSQLINAGQRLGASQLAVLHSHGIETISVTRKIRVAVFSTGDELVKAGQTLPEGSIFEANRVLIQGLLSSSAIEIIDVGIVADSHAATMEAMQQCGDADVVISSGGVSVGEADFVRPALEQQGHLHMWKIAMKPGRPLTFGLLKEGKPYFGLPGNPVSSAVTCIMFVLPAIKHMLAQPVSRLPRVNATVTSDLRKLPGRIEYQRGMLAQDQHGNWLVTTTGLQDSHVITSLHKANCFVELGFESTGVLAGDQVQVIPFELFSDSKI